MWQIITPLTVLLSLLSLFSSQSPTDVQWSLLASRWSNNPKFCQDSFRYFNLYLPYHTNSLNCSTRHNLSFIKRTCLNSQIKIYRKLQYKTPVVIFISRNPLIFPKFQHCEYFVSSFRSSCESDWLINWTSPHLDLS